MYAVSGKLLHQRYVKKNVIFYFTNQTENLKY